MADIGKLTPVVGTPWPHRHIQPAGDNPRRERPPRREPEKPRQRDDDEPNHIDEYA